jgi:hypothetical protein
LLRDEAHARAFGAETLRLGRDDLFDIGAYRESAGMIESRYVAFFNSFSEIVANEWLARLYCGIRRDGVGLVGATGTWESLASNAFQEMKERPLPGYAVGWLYKWRFSPHFPNPHIRTNGFIMERDTFLALKAPQTRSKQLAYAFESGWRSMTRQIERQGANLAAPPAGSYLDAPAESNPLLHTWSLSVEEQFYLVFPAIFLLGWAFLSRDSDLCSLVRPRLPDTSAAGTSQSSLDQFAAAGDMGRCSTIV